MSIAIDATILEDRRWTGVERYLAGLVEGLSGLDLDFDVALVSRVPVALPRPLGPRMRAIVTGPSRLPLSIWRELVLRPLVRRIGCTVLHAGIGAIPLLPGGIRRIATVHELTWLHTKDPMRAMWRHKLRVAAAAAAADRVVVNSRHTQSDVLQVHPRLAGRTRVIYPGIDPSFRPPTDDDKARAAEARARYGIPPGPFFLYVGRLEPKKNIDLMLDAMAGLPGDPSLVLIGRDLYPEGAFAAMVGERHLGERVIRPGFVDDADLVPLLQSAQALLYVSQMEGFGFPPLEAMACGTPAIVSNRGAIPEVTGGAAIVVDPDDRAQLPAAMRRMLEDSALRGRLSDAGTARAGEFTYEAGARALVQLYSELL